MEQQTHYHLFERFGIEIEYMIVDQTTLAVKPMAGELFGAAGGPQANSVERGPVTWTNGIANHLLKMKTSGPVASLEGLEAMFLENIREINKLLLEDGACLLGSGMHPFMNPRSEVKLWQNRQRIVYAALDRIFSCKRHGWSNVQSMHINMPFANDDEFGRLHAAVRLVLPIIPALTAGSPLMENNYSGFHDTRLEIKRSNSMLVPEINGDIVPEPFFLPGEYKREILEPIYRGLAPHDPEGILCEEWINGRGAIARFDRNTIEIRACDTQETAAADVACAAAIVGVVRLCATEKFISFDKQKAWPTDPLRAIMLDTIKSGERAKITDGAYLETFGCTKGPCTAGDLWRHLADALAKHDQDRIAPFRTTLDHILSKGTLSSRIADLVGPKASWKKIDEVYRALCENLQDGALL